VFSATQSPFLCSPSHSVLIYPPPNLEQLTFSFPGSESYLSILLRCPGPLLVTCLLPQVKVFRRKPFSNVSRGNYRWTTHVLSPRPTIFRSSFTNREWRGECLSTWSQGRRLKDGLTSFGPKPLYTLSLPLERNTSSIFSSVFFFPSRFPLCDPWSSCCKLSDGVPFQSVTKTASFFAQSDEDFALPSNLLKMVLCFAGVECEPSPNTYALSLFSASMFFLLRRRSKCFSVWGPPRI